MKQREKMTLGEWLIILVVLAVLAVATVPLFRAQRENMGEKLDRANENAAKLSAVILYYGSSEDAGTDFVRYYDAENNALLEEKPLDAAYGCGTAAGSETAENRGKFLRVEAKAEEGIVSVSWVEFTDEELEEQPELRGYRE